MDYGVIDNYLTILLYICQNFYGYQLCLKMILMLQKVRI